MCWPWPRTIARLVPLCPLHWPGSVSLVVSTCRLVPDSGSLLTLDWSVASSRLILVVLAVDSYRHAPRARVPVVLAWLRLMVVHSCRLVPLCCPLVPSCGGVSGSRPSLVPGPLAWTRMGSYGRLWLLSVSLVGPPCRPRCLWLFQVLLRCFSWLPPGTPLVLSRGQPRRQPKAAWEQHLVTKAAWEIVQCEMVARLSQT